MSDPAGTVQVKPMALVATSDVVRGSADVIGSLALPVGVEVMVAPELAMLQQRLASFEEARSRHDAKVFETFRFAAEFLAVTAVDVIAADNAEFVPLPSAGW
jgi:hypothetical protein